MADPLDTLPLQLLRCQNFSALATGEVDLLDTQPTAYLPLFLVVMLRGVAGFTSVPTISIGTNASNYDNIVAASSLAGLDALGECFVKQIGTNLAAGVFRLQSANSAVSLKARVTVAAVASQYDIEVQLIGVYV